LPVWISDVFFTLWSCQFVERVRLTLFRKKQFTKVKKKIMPSVLKEEVCLLPLKGQSFERYIYFRKKKNYNMYCLEKRNIIWTTPFKGWK